MVINDPHYGTCGNSSSKCGEMQQHHVRLNMLLEFWKKKIMEIDLTRPFVTGEIFPELYTTPSLEEEEENSEDQEAEVEECEPSPSARPALSALPAPQPSPKEDSLTNIDAQYYR